MGSLASELRPIAAELAESPRVYVDANVPVGAVEFMRRTLRWDVLFVLEDPDLRRASDREHFRRALDLGRTLVTLDRDFCDDKRFPPADSPGVVVCVAPDERALRRLLHEIDRVLFQLDTAALPLRGRKLQVATGFSQANRHAR